MKQSEIKVGGYYEARVSGNFVTVRVDDIRKTFLQGRMTSTGICQETSRTVYDVTNLDTGRKLTFISAQKFRRPLTNRQLFKDL